MKNTQRFKKTSQYIKKNFTSPDLIIKKFEQLLIDLQPLKEKLNGTGELSLVEISKKIRNLLKVSFEDGNKRVGQFNQEGGNFYRKLHSTSYRIDNSHALSIQDNKYLENIIWHEMKINEFLDEVKLVKEIQNSQSSQDIKVIHGQINKLKEKERGTNQKAKKIQNEQNQMWGHFRKKAIDIQGELNQKYNHLKPYCSMKNKLSEFMRR